jgi:hypothetical protein
MRLKEEIIKILTPIFGEGIRGTIEELYSEENPQELYNLVRHLLEGVIGPKNTDILLHKRLDFKKLNIKEV